MAPGHQVGLPPKVIAKLSHLQAERSTSQPLMIMYLWRTGGLPTRTGSEVGKRCSIRLTLVPDNLQESQQTTPLALVLVQCADTLHEPTDDQAIFQYLQIILAHAIVGGLPIISIVPLSDLP